MTETTPSNKQPKLSTADAKEKEKEEIDIAPTTLTVAKQINNTHQGRFHHETLSDSGATNNVITRNVLPKDVELFNVKTPIVMDTGNGPCACTKCVHVNDIMFPELSSIRKCKRKKCTVNEKNLGCDLIIGRIFLWQVGLNVNFDEAEVTWQGEAVPSHPRDHFEDNQLMQKILTNEPCSTA